MASLPPVITIERTRETRDGQRVLAVIIAFHPDAGLHERIKAVSNQVQKTLVIDNTPSPALTVKASCADIDNLEWRSMAANTGVAAALNMGLEATREGFTHLLTLDQDSLLPTGAVDQLLATSRSSNDIAVVGPIFHGRTGNRSWIPWRRGIFIIPRCPSPSTGLYNSLFAITSGSLISVEAAKNIGPFDNRLFVDAVDHEFCLRAWREGYRVVVDSAVDMAHELGDRSRGGVLGLRSSAPNHSPLRCYYITRNRFLLYKKHGRSFPQYVLYDLMSAIRELGLLILVERDRKAKLGMMWIGFVDGIGGKTGPFE